MSGIRYINRDELAELMKSDKIAARDFIVVDVRDDDYAGGNIKGSINIPSQEFLMNVDGLVTKTKVYEIGCAVPVHADFYTEAPKLLEQIYSETKQNIQNDSALQEVVILRDGFSEFQVKYKDDPTLVENWDKDVWASEWS